MALSPGLHPLDHFMNQIASDMGSEYRRIFEHASSDPGTAGDQSEENWKNLLINWLPYGYHVETKGHIIGFDGQRSPQIDIVVLKPSYPAKLREKKTWLADGVAAAFECKATLKAAHIKSALERSVKFKDRATSRSGTPFKDLRSPIIYGLLADSHSWKAAGSDPIGNILGTLSEGRSKLEHPRNEVDLICVADLATWSAIYTVPYGDPLPSGPHTGIAQYDSKNGAQSESFEPLGTLISELWNRLAFDDPALRPIATYFRRTIAKSGNIAEILREWSQSALSTSTLNGIKEGKITNEPGWSEWNVFPNGVLKVFNGSEWKAVPTI